MRMHDADINHNMDLSIGNQPDAFVVLMVKTTPTRILDIPNQRPHVLREIFNSGGGGLLHEEGAYAT